VTSECDLNTVINHVKQTQLHKLKVENMRIDQVRSFIYLGVTVNGNNTLEEEIRERIGKGNKAFYANKTLFIFLYAELNPICHSLILLGYFKFMGTCVVSIFQYIFNNITQFIYIWKLLYMFRVVLPPIITSAYNCIYSICYSFQI
jgi:hypothetical protein